MHLNHATKKPLTYDDDRKTGYIYVIEATNKKSVKIGSSRMPDKRVRAIQTLTNSFGRVWISERQYSAKKIEYASHAANKNCRLNGEWFAITFENAVASVISFCGPPADHPIEYSRELARAEGERIFTAIEKHFSKA